MSRISSINLPATESHFTSLPSLLLNNPLDFSRFSSSFLSSLLIYFITSQLICQQLVISTSEASAAPAAAAAAAAAGTIGLANDHDETDGTIPAVKAGHGIYKRQNTDYNMNYQQQHGSSDDEDQQHHHPSRLDQQYREKLKEMSQDSERSYNDIMRELRKDQILIQRDQDEDQRHWEDGTLRIENLYDDHGDNQDNHGKVASKPPSNFWTILICAAIVVIITLVAIIISLAVHNHRALQSQTYRAPNLEAPKIVVEENVYTTTTAIASANNNNNNNRSSSEGQEAGEVRESLLPFDNPNPQRQPMAPFTYSPIPVRTDN